MLMFGGSLLVSVMVTSLLVGGGTSSPDDKVVKSESTKLVQMGSEKDGGAVYLGGESEKDKVGSLEYVYRQGDTVRAGAVSTHKVVVFDDAKGGSARLDVVTRTQSSGWIAPSMFRSYITYEFHVPSGTVPENLNHLLQ